MTYNPLEQKLAALKEAIQQADLASALNEVQNAIRQAPGAIELRVYLFQLLCIQGNWTRAMGQLQTIAKLDSSKIEFVQTYHHLITAEAFRTAVFAGEKTPLVFGDAAPWIPEMLSALKCEANGEYQAASDLRAKALELAPAVPIQVNGEPVQWLADADSRLGPVFELMVNGGFYWVPQTAIKSIEFDPVEDLRDVIWRPLSITFQTEGKFVAFMPVRYPDSESSENVLHQLSRLTEWDQFGVDQYKGVGQRMFATPESDLAMLEIESMQFDAE